MAEPGSPDITRRDFLKLSGAAAVGTILPGNGERQTGVPEVDRSLEQAGIKGVDIVFVYGNHFLDQATADKFKRQRIRVLTGEISKSRGITWLGGESEQDRSALDDVLSTFGKLPNGVSGKEMLGAARRSYGLRQEFLESGGAVLVSDADQGLSADWLQKAGDRSTLGWTSLATLTYLVGLGIKTDVLSGGTVSRRGFIKGVAAGAAALIGTHLGLSTHAVLENQGVISPLANVEVSYLYSKIFDKVAVGGTQIGFELLGDKKLIQTLEAMVAIRNKIMTLNNWYLAGAIERNPKLREVLGDNNGEVKIGFYAGAGHSSATSEFCKGPKEIGKEIGAVVGNWLDQYEKDLNEASLEKKAEITKFYKSMLKMFNKPELLKTDGLPFEKGNKKESILEIDTPVTVVYKTLISRSKSSEACKEMLGELIKDQHVAEGTWGNVNGNKMAIENGKPTNHLGVNNPDSLRMRLNKINLIPTVKEGEKVKGEKFDNLFAYKRSFPGVYEEVRIGLAIVDGIPVTYSHLEDTSFINERL